MTMDIADWRSDLEAATVDMLSRAFVNNPIHIAAFGAESVLACNRTFFRAGLSLFRGRRIVAIDGTKVVGFAHWVESPACQFSMGQRLGLIPTMLTGFGLQSTLRVGSWLSAWAKHDGAGRHRHFGPVGVDPDARGKGIGRRLMNVFCAELDGQSAVGFLETDKPENVTFYRKFGFEVSREVDVIGTTTYFMTRQAARGTT